MNHISNTIDIRPRFPKLLIEKLKARSSQTGLSLTQLIRHYTLLGLCTEAALPDVLPTLGNISTYTPCTSRKTCIRVYIDGDLVPAMKHTPEAMDSISRFVNTAIRNELLKRKNQGGG